MENIIMNEMAFGKLLGVFGGHGKLFGGFGEGKLVKVGIIILLGLCYGINWHIAL